MRRLFYLLFVFLFILSFCGCSLSKTTSERSAAIKTDSYPILNQYEDYKTDIQTSFIEFASMSEDILNITNEYRKTDKIHTLKYSEDLSILASIRAREIAESKKYSHFRPNGNYFSSVFKEAGLTEGRVGENVAWELDSATVICNEFNLSQRHRENMKNSEWFYMGIGIVELPTDEPSFVCVELFADNAFQAGCLSEK